MHILINLRLASLWWKMDSYQSVDLYVGSNSKNRIHISHPCCYWSKLNICYQTNATAEAGRYYSTFSGKNSRCHYLCASLQVFFIGLLPNNTKEIMSFEYEVCLLINKLQPKATFDFKVTEDLHSSIASIFLYSSFHIFFNIFYLFFSA